MSYRVRIVPRPVVVDASDAQVVGARVLEIIFPTDTIVTAVGRVNGIVGPGAAKIMIGHQAVRGVPLC